MQIILEEPKKLHNKGKQPFLSFTVSLSSAKTGLTVLEAPGWMLTKGYISPPRRALPNGSYVDLLRCPPQFYEAVRELLLEANWHEEFNIEAPIPIDQYTVLNNRGRKSSGRAL